MSESPDLTAKSAPEEGAREPRSAAGAAPGLVAFFFKRLNEEHISSAAAALTYSSTLAVVPALALVLASLAAFPGFSDLRENLQRALVNNLVPEMGLKISETLSTFIAAAGQLTAVGVIGLMSTAILLLLTIEGQLNLIFHVAQPRPWLTRILMFWAVMTVGPLLLGAGVTLLGYFSALPFLEKSSADSTTTFVLGHLVPSVLTWIVVSLVFLLLPNRRIRPVDAFIGAAVAALLLAMLRYTFALYVLLATSYQAIYGALAAVPVFLVWLFLVWFSVMVGAVVTAALPDWRFARTGYADRPASRIILAVEVLSCLSTTRRDGRSWTRIDLVKAINVPEALLTSALDVLRAARFVAHTDAGEWVLSRDLERTTLADLIPHFGIGLGFGLDASAVEVNALGHKLNMHIRGAAESERSLLSVSLARLVVSADDTAPTAA